METYRNEHRILCRNGNYKWILDKGKVVQANSAGKPIRIIGTHTDITYRNKKEEQFERYLELITSQNQRLHNFTHIVSHNLKTYTGNFKTILEFLDDTIEKTKKKSYKVI